MLAIKGLKCIYDTGARGWSLELILGGEGDEAVRRFEVDGPDDAEMLIEAFEQSSSSLFDPATGEIVFAYEYAEYGDDEDEDDEEDDEDEDDAEDDASEDEDKKVKS